MPLQPSTPWVVFKPSVVFGAYSAPDGTSKAGC